MSTKVAEVSLDFINLPVTTGRSQDGRVNPRGTEEEALARGNASPHAGEETCTVLHKGTGSNLTTVANAQEKEIVRKAARHEALLSGKEYPRAQGESNEHHAKGTPLGDGSRLTPREP